MKVPNQCSCGSFSFVGVDLAGSPKRPTGFCVLRGRSVETRLIYRDEEAVKLIEDAGALVVAVDAPLSMPTDRHCLEEHCRGRSHLRMCDLELRTLGIRFFPVTLGPMRSLTMRGIALKNVLEANGLEVIETYPGGAQDVWGIPRRRDSEGLRRGLKTWVAGDVDKPKITGHELDAITCAIVAELYSRGEYIALGDPREGLIILPRLTMSLRSQSGHPS